jgi:hypothetical protein
MTSIFLEVIVKHHGPIKKSDEPERNISPGTCSVKAKPGKTALTAAEGLDIFHDACP